MDHLRAARRVDKFVGRVELLVAERRVTGAQQAPTGQLVIGTTSKALGTIDVPARQDTALLVETADHVLLLRGGLVLHVREDGILRLQEPFQPG